MVSSVWAADRDWVGFGFESEIWAEMGMRRMRRARVVEKKKRDFGVMVLSFEFD